VAALLELARFLKTVEPAQGLEVRLVFYVNEELPWFGTDKMGSSVHSKGLAAEGKEVVADAVRSRRWLVQRELRQPTLSVSLQLVLIRRRATSSASSPTLRSRGLMQPRDRRVPARGGVSLGRRRGARIDTGIGWSDQWAYWQFDCLR